MVDESKHTEDADLSRFDYADISTVQDTNRNLHKPSEDLATAPTIDMRGGDLQSDGLGDAAHSTKKQRGSSKNRKKGKKAGNG